MNPSSDKVVYAAAVATAERIGATVHGLFFHGHLAIAFIAAGLACSSLIVAGIPMDGWLVVFISASSFAVYQLDSDLGSVVSDSLNHRARVVWRNRHRATMRLLTGASLAIAITLLVGRFVHLVGVVVVVGAVALAYCVPVLPRIGRLKDVWFLKPVAIALAWALATVLLPLAGTSADVPVSTIVAVLAYRFVFLLPNAVASDLPDAGGDALAGLETPATKWGAKLLVPVCLAVWVLLAIGLPTQIPRIELKWVVIEETGLLVSAAAVYLWHDSRRQIYRDLVDGALLWFVAAVPLAQLL